MLISSFLIVQIKWSVADQIKSFSNDRGWNLEVRASCSFLDSHILRLEKRKIQHGSAFLWSSLHYSVGSGVYTEIRINTAPDCAVHMRFYMLIVD